MYFVFPPANKISHYSASLNASRALVYRAAHWLLYILYFSCINSTANGFFHLDSGVPVDPDPDNLFAGSFRVHAGTLGILILSLRQNHISTD
jgi:hypothetical protein